MATVQSKILIVVGGNRSGLYLYPTPLIERFEALSYQTPHQVLASLADSSIKIVVIDDSVPVEKGFDLLQQIKTFDPAIHLILCLDTGQTDLAARAIRLGATVLNQSINPDQLQSDPLFQSMILHDLDPIDKMANLRGKTHRLEMQALKCYEFEGMVGRNPMMLEIFSMIRRFAPHFSSVLITGETGTGKEMVAQALHHLSPRSKNQFVVCNCAALVAGLLESELFGHIKGAFTGAHQARQGLFELAHGGTIFLDEMGELPQLMQSKLLRVLEAHEFQRVGSPHVIRIDIRVIAATNKDLEKAIANGTFREDLFHRINMMQIHLPPLRDRRDDIPLLIRHFIEKATHRLKKHVKGLSREGQILLMRYDWPGNIRELQNVLERAVIMTDKEFISMGDLPTYIQVESRAPTHLSISPYDLKEDPPLKELERWYIKKVLQKTAGNKIQSSKILGLSRSTLYRKLEQFDLEKD